MNGLTGLALTKLDVLDNLPAIQVATAAGGRFYLTGSATELRALLGTLSTAVVEQRGELEVLMARGDTREDRALRRLVAVGDRVYVTLSFHEAPVSIRARRQRRAAPDPARAHGVGAFIITIGIVAPTAHRSSSASATMSLLSSTAGRGSTNRLAPLPELPWMIPGS